MSASRRHIRFEPDHNTYVLVRIEGSDKTHSGLCVDESQGGCAGVFKVDPDFLPKSMVIVKTGKLEALPGEIRWVRVLDDDVIKVGIRYLDQ